jgi:hypothetical protein
MLFGIEWREVTAVRSSKQLELNTRMTLTVAKQAVEMKGVPEPKVYGGADVQFHVFLASVLVGGEKFSFTTRPFYPPGAHCTGDWAISRADLHAAGKRKLSSHCQESNSGPSSP